jgi:hypothetical protein
MVKRGRPSKIKTEVVDTEVSTPSSTKFERVFKNEDGSIDVWKFDMDKNPNGPYETIISYPKGTKTFEQIQEVLPKTKRKYLNPENGKEVAYTRAKELGLVS